MNNDRKEELRKTLEEEGKEPETPKRGGFLKQGRVIGSGRFKVKVNWGFCLLVLMFAWFVIDWFIWGPGRIGG